MTATMSIVSLPTLPKEILDLITESIPRSSILNVCRACRTLQQVAVIQLYKDVYFRSMGQTGSYPEEPVDHPNELANMRIRRAQYSSRINDLSLFLRTIISSPSLRSLVFHATFEWGHRFHHQFKMVITTTLSFISSQLKTLRYSSPFWDFSAPHLPLTSIRTPYPDWSRSSDRLGREHAYALFMTPTLRKITFLQHDTIEGFPSGPFMSMARSSNVESLFMLNLRQIYKDLLEVLTWPKALKSFYCELRETLYGRPITIMQVKQALYVQRDSLEQIIISTCVHQLDQTCIGDFANSLHDFPVLKRLAIPMEYLLLGHPTTENNIIATSPDHLLPPNLEELHLDISEVALFPQFRLSSLDPDWVRDDSQVKSLMQEILIHKKEYFPCLRRILLWRFDYRMGGQNSLASERLLSETIGVSQDMERMGIDFSCQYHGDMPQVWGVPDRDFF